MKKIIKFISIILAIVAALFGVHTAAIGKVLVKIIVKLKHPSYRITNVKMQKVDFFSTVKEVTGAEIATCAVVVIENKTDRRTLHLEKFLWFWLVKNDAPDFGPDVPEDEYYIEISGENRGKLANIDAIIEREWILPAKDGSLYKKIGDEDWYYTFLKVQAIYRTLGGRVYALNKQNFAWEQTEIPYSELDYLGNYDKISKEEAEKLINERKSKH